ncbi:branched-chain amino acid ABC transporter permease [Streptomyces sp. NPDC055815]
MTTLAETVFNGLALGSVYALVTLGFVVIFRASGAMNFAHGSLLLFGGYLVARLHTPLGFAGAMAVALACTAGVAVLQALLLRGTRTSAPATLAILTIGVDVLLSTELSRRIGSDVLDLGDPWGAEVTKVLGVTVPDARIASLAVAVVLIGAFLLAFRYTSWGLSMRASTADREAAALMGIRPGRLQISAWCLAGALAVVAALFLVAFPTPGLDRATGHVALKAFPAAILGGMDSVGGALAGSLLIGLTEAFASGYQSELSFLGEGLSGVAPYAVLVLVLLIRPHGLFGSKELTRV